MPGNFESLQQPMSFDEVRFALFLPSALTLCTAGVDDVDVDLCAPTQRGGSCTRAARHLAARGKYTCGKRNVLLRQGEKYSRGERNLCESKTLILEKNYYYYYFF